MFRICLCRWFRAHKLMARSKYIFYVSSYKLSVLLSPFETKSPLIKPWFGTSVKSLVFFKSTWVNLVISILVSGLKTVHKRGLRGLKCPRGSVSGAKGDLKTVKSFISIVFPAGPHFAALDLDSFLDIFGYLGLTTNYTVRTILCANIIKAIHNKPFSFEPLDSSAGLELYTRHRIF